MREIIFRGKRVDNGEWVFGVPIWDESNPEPMRMMVANIERYPHGNNWEVIPETVGQYTGLKDKNGTMIFEGDVLSFEMPDETCVTRNLKGVVYFTEGVFWVDCTEIENDDEALYMLGMFDEDENAEIIGNIHDQKEDV